MAMTNYEYWQLREMLKIERECERLARAERRKDPYYEEPDWDYERYCDAEDDVGVYPSDEEDI